MATDADLMQLAAELAGVLTRLAQDVESAEDGGAHIEWPAELRERFQEHAGLKAAMTWASERMSTEQKALVKPVYREARDSAELPDFPVTPLLPETRAAVDDAFEQVKRARALDRAFDEACAREAPRW